MNTFERLKKFSFESIPQEAVFYLLAAAGHYQQILEDICGEFDLTYNQYNILRILKDVYPGGHPRFEIIDRMIVPAPDVTRLLNRLENKGLIERTKSEEDKRFSIALITEKGLGRLERMSNRFTSASENFTTGVSKKESEQFIETCEKFCRNC